VEHVGIRWDGHGSAYGSEGWGFESLQARQTPRSDPILRSLDFADPANGTPPRSQAFTGTWKSDSTGLMVDRN
jgi:hypothetical protein